MASITELVKSLLGDPAALSAVKAGLAALPPVPPKPRDVMPAEERKALGMDLRRRQDAFARFKAEADVKAEETRRRIQADQELLAALGREVLADADAYCSWRDAQTDRPWAERPTLVDELIARCVEEAHALLPQAASRPNPVFAGLFRGSGEMLGPEVVARNVAPFLTRSNRSSVEARQKALYALAENVKEWTIKGAYADERELRSKFDKAYSNLPAVQALAA